MTSQKTRVLVTLFCSKRGEGLACLLQSTESHVGEVVWLKYIQQPLSKATWSPQHLTLSSFQPFRAPSLYSGTCPHFRAKQIGETLDSQAAHRLSQYLEDKIREGTQRWGNGNAPRMLIPHSVQRDYHYDTGGCPQLKNCHLAPRQG